MDGVVVHTISISIVFEAAGRTYLVVEHPSVVVISLDGGLHEQGAAQHVGHVAIESLHIF